MTPEEWMEREIELISDDELDTTFGHRVVYLRRTFERIKGLKPEDVYVWGHEATARVIVSPGPPTLTHIRHGWVLLAFQSKYGFD